MSCDRRATCARASDLLATRIEINRNHSAADFRTWLLERLRPGEGDYPPASVGPLAGYGRRA